MPIEHSVVTDNSLLPFAGTGAIFVPRGDDNVSPAIDISSIFEDGFLLGANRMTRMTVETNGPLRFLPVSGVGGSITPVWFDQDTRALPPGINNSGIWVDFNTDRDSIVLTWNGVGQYFQRVDHPSTYQVEIRDLGAGDSEVIYRFYDVSYNYNAYSSSISSSFGNAITPLLQMGAFDLWDTTTGNTGVTGVWQFRIEDGRVVAEDLALAPVNRVGSEDADSLTGWLGDDRLNALGGNDTLDGQAGNDRLMGGNGDNVVYGGLGNDTITTGDGADSIEGGAGSNIIGAGAGNDTIRATGFDTVYAAAGDDLIQGTGYNRLNAYGGTGNDTVTGGGASDRIFGDDGNDSLTGDDITLYGGNDSMYGGAGADTLAGLSGSDSLDGGDGNDVLLGGYGNDSLYGGAGDDFIFGSLGRDVATGGAGADRFFASREAGDSLRITDYNRLEGDVLVLDGTLFSPDELRLQSTRTQALDGTPGAISELSLVRVDSSGVIVQTIFTFDHPEDIDRLVLRLPAPGPDGMVLGIDVI